MEAVAGDGAEDALYVLVSDTLIEVPVGASSFDEGERCRWCRGLVEVAVRALDIVCSVQSSLGTPAVAVAHRAELVDSAKASTP